MENQPIKGNTHTCVSWNYNLKKEVILLGATEEMCEEYWENMDTDIRV